MDKMHSPRQWKRGYQSTSVHNTSHTFGAGSVLCVYYAVALADVGTKDACQEQMRKLNQSAVSSFIHARMLNHAMHCDTPSKVSPVFRSCLRQRA